MAGPGRLVIFTEGDLVRGLGHVSRCSAYAEAWQARGGEVQWVLDGNEAAAAMTGASEVRTASWQTDVAGLLGALPSGVALVDSYSATEAVLAQIGSWAEAAIFIDDLRRDYPGGLVVHAAPDAAVKQAVASDAIWLEGPEWQPLRPAFWDLPPRPSVRAEIEHVLVIMGGGDLRGLGGVMAELAAATYPKANIDVVMAPEQPEPAHPRVTAHRRLDAGAMARLMMRADLAISGAGQTVFELARCGAPAVLVGIADNQQPNLDHWPSLCGFITAGRWDSPGLMNRVRAALVSLSPARVRQDISERAAAVVDGQGVRRLFERLDQTRRA